MKKVPAQSTSQNYASLSLPAPVWSDCWNWVKACTVPWVLTTLQHPVQHLSSVVWLGSPGLERLPVAMQSCRRARYTVLSVVIIVYGTSVALLGRPSCCDSVSSWVVLVTSWVLGEGEFYILDRFAVQSHILLSLTLCDILKQNNWHLDIFCFCENL